ncbi:MAG: DUF1998 domain-containing protein, partial [Candidatus Latescibacterota bacterium]
ELEKKWHGSQVFWGDLSVTSVTFMFKKIKFASRDSLGFGTLDLPAQTLLTTGMWLLPDEDTYAYVRKAGRIPREGLLGIANVIKEVIPIFAMCDTMDIGATVDSSAANAPGIYVYDRYPGGLGFALKAYELLGEIMEASLDLIDQCACDGGCPSCVGSPLPPFSQLDPDANARGMIPDKEAAKSILHALLNKDYYQPSKKETDSFGQPIEEDMTLPEVKPLPVPLERKLRERVDKLKRMRSPRTR